MKRKLLLKLQEFFAFIRICKEKVRTGFLYDIDSICDIPEEVKQKVINLVSKCPVHKTLAKEIYFANYS